MSVSVNLNNTERVMYCGNNHVKCIYGPNNQLLWSEEEYFTIEATGSGFIRLNLVNTGDAAQMESIRYYYWKNTIPNAARDNYTGTLVGGNGTVATGSRIDYVAGDIIRLYRPEQTAIGNGINNVNRFNGGFGNTKIYGNLASLIGYANTLPAKAFIICFYFCQFTDCSGLILPWDNLPTFAFRWMFYGCTQITEIPFLPATTVGVQSYGQLFRQCNGLTNVDLTQKMCARNANSEAFINMFFSCANLTSIKIPANINYLGTNTWKNAFWECSSLNNIICLDENPSTTKYDNWLYGLGGTGTGTFTKKTGITWPSGVSGIPEGWTVIEE